MVKLVSAKCPSCGAALKLSKDEERVKCEYCHQTILVDDAIASVKLKVSGSVSIEGIETNSDLIKSANELMEMQEFLKAKKKFLEFSEKCPNDYQGWLGLLICRTRNFTIKDNNVLFENDINNYYEHFIKVAPEDIKEKYNKVMDDYLNTHTEKIKTNILEKDIKIDSKSIPYIFSAMLIIAGLVLLFNSIILGSLLWIASGIILLPKVSEQLKLSRKKAIIITVILWIVGFFAFALESPYAFIGKWETSTPSMSIEFKKNRCSFCWNRYWNYIIVFWKCRSNRLS